MTVEVSDQDIDELVFMIDPGVRIPVRIYLEDIEGTLVRFEDRLAAADSGSPNDGGRIRVSLNGNDGQVVVASRSGERESFEFADVAPGSYAVVLSNTNAEFFVKRLEVSGMGLPEDVIEVAPGVGSIDILLSANGGRVVGTTRNNDGNSVGHAHVVLVPEPRLRGQVNSYRTAISDQDGHFELQAIAPGAYQLYSWDYLDSADYYDPEFLRRFEHRGQDVVLEESNVRSMDLEVFAGQ